jgi:hypothetical protein
MRRRNDEKPGSPVISSPGARLERLSQGIRWPRLHRGHLRDSGPLILGTLRRPGAEEVGVAGYGAREETDMDHAIPAHIDNLNNGLGLGVAADDVGADDRSSGVGGLAEERPGQAGVVLRGEVDPDVD